MVESSEVAVGKESVQLLRSLPEPEFARGSFVAPKDVNTWHPVFLYVVLIPKTHNPVHCPAGPNSHISYLISHILNPMPSLPSQSAMSAPAPSTVIADDAAADVLDIGAAFRTCGHCLRLEFLVRRAWRSGFRRCSCALGVPKLLTVLDILLDYLCNCIWS